MKKALLCIFILLNVNTVFAAATATPKGKITGYYTGWAADQIRVTIEGAAYVESNCPIKDGYITRDSDNSGYKTHTSALLAAYMSGKSVTLIIDGCIEGRPRILGVYID